MSKVICEICGTAYPDTENECPVCGFEKPETAEFAPEEAVDTAVPASVKGGRFSKGNVSKKSSVPEKRSAEPTKRKNSKKRNGGDTGLIVAIIVLLVAIIATAGYIYFNYFAPEKAPAKDTEPAQTTTQPSVQTLPQQTQGTTEADLSCTGLTLYEETVSLNQVGSQWLLNVVPTPANTSDVITYTSADESIATVSEDGKITAVANGETTITITCGDVSVACKVVCQLAEVTEPEETEPEETEPQETEPEETEPEETEPEETEPEETKPKGDFKFNTKYYQNDRWEVTMSVGDTWTAYAGDIDAADIQWTIGNTSVATVKNGKVKAVGTGWTTLRAVYNGVEYKCLIYVQ